MNQHKDSRTIYLTLVFCVAFFQYPWNILYDTNKSRAIIRRSCFKELRTAHYNRLQYFTIHFWGPICISRAVRWTRRSSRMEHKEACSWYLKESVKPKISKVNDLNCASLLDGIRYEIIMVGTTFIPSVYYFEITVISKFQVQKTLVLKQWDESQTYEYILHF